MSDPTRETVTAPAPGLHIGVDYYPEHWPESRWPRDAGLMAGMGVDFARMGEFAWHRFEPREGDYDFAWMDRAIEILAAHGIRTILGTPSAAPPAWLIRKHPEILPLDSQGRRAGFGGRHHDCQSNPAYRRSIRRLVTAMARHYRDNPHVVGWQIDNELGNSHDDLCFCRSCVHTFQGWLEEKYGSVEALNEAWGTAFWSQTYNSFTEIDAPRHTVAGKNPSQELDWKRFCSDLIVDFQRLQVDILRRECPRHFITHNLMSFAEKVNYYDLARDLDFVSHDQYPSGFYLSGIDPARSAAQLDVVRSFAGRPFWIMEQQAGASGWGVMGRTPEPGQLALWATQAVAHGADAVCFFRWRTCTVGTEQYWHGILPHHGEPGRRYAELAAWARAIRPQLAELAGSMPEARVAIVYDYDQYWALRIQPQNQALRYVDELQHWYRLFHEQNITVDFIPEGRRLDGYCLVVAPLQYLMRPGQERLYCDYVSGGGHLILGYRAGVKDDSNRVRAGAPLPGALLGGLLGLRIHDYDCLQDAAVGLRAAEDEAVPAGTGTIWADWIELDGAHPLLRYDGYNDDGPAATVHEYGAGRACYFGTRPDHATLARLLVPLLTELGLAPDPASGLEVIERTAGTARWRFRLNHGSAPQGGLPPYGYDITRLDS